MRMMVVYDSVYGNTERIARAIGDAIKVDGKLLRATEVKPADLGSLDLLVVGSPTRAFRPTRALQELIRAIPGGGLANVEVAVFDTRLSQNDVGKGLQLLMKTGGYAGPWIAQALKRKGASLVVPTEGFLVEEKEGPLKKGELERATLWAKGLTKAGK